jgi:hypothetical protein
METVVRQFDPSIFQDKKLKKIPVPIMHKIQRRSDWHQALSYYKFFKKKHERDK